MKELKLFSERNLRSMVYFYEEYSEYEISPLPVAKLETSTNLIWQPSVAKLENKAKTKGKPPVSQLAAAISPTALAKLENQSDFKQKLILSTR